jgi:hypothetical protein
MIGLGIGTNRIYRSGGSGFTGLLDVYSGAAAAYSLRRLSSTYLGDAIKVTTNGVNSADIGFVNNELDTASLEAFAGGGEAYVTTWYDQSGNGNDATQSVFSDMPKIVSNGSTILDNGKPIITPSLGGHFDVNTVLNPNNDTTQFIVAKYTSGGSIANTFYEGGNRYVLAAKQGDGSNPFIDFPDVSNLNGSSYSFGSRNDLYQDVQTQSLFSLYWQQVPNTEFTKIGWTSTSWSMWNTQELIIYNNNQASNISSIEANINSHYSIYP